MRFSRFLFGAGVAIVLFAAYNAGWRYYYWHLERYGGTYCHLKDNDQDRWVYIGRQDMLNALAVVWYGTENYDSDEYGELIRRKGGEPINIYRTKAEALAKAIHIRHNLLKRTPNLVELQQMHGLRNWYEINISEPYNRKVWGMHDRAVEPCTLYRLLEAARQGK